MITFPLNQIQPHASVISIPKRLLDIVGASIGLLILAAIVIPIAVAIKLENPGPVFFSQIRYGLNGQQFRLYKFRTMVQEAEVLKTLVVNEARGPMFKNSADPRVSGLVGRFLRCTSLDEMPQFFNILIGEMSLVGPRPPITEEVVRYTSRQWSRLSVKPGLTGAWQVNGRSEVADFETMLTLDLHYQKEWSLWHDLKILGQTVGVVLKKTGAY